MRERKRLTYIVHYYTSSHTIIHSHICILHSHRDHGSQNIESLPHDGACFEGVCLQEAVEDLQDDPLVDGEPGDDVSQQQVTVVLGGWVLGGWR